MKPTSTVPTWDNTKYKLPELQTLAEHCKGIRIAINRVGSIIGYLPCQRCSESGDWCGEHRIIEAGADQEAVSRKARIDLFRKSFDRARTGGLIPIPVEEESKPVSFENVISIRRGA